MDVPALRVEAATLLNGGLSASRRIQLLEQLRGKVAAYDHQQLTNASGTLIAALLRKKRPLHAVLGHDNDTLRLGVVDFIGFLAASSASAKGSLVKWLQTYFRTTKLESEDTDLYVILSVIEVVQAFWTCVDSADVSAEDEERSPEAHDARGTSRGDDPTNNSLLNEATVVPAVSARLPLLVCCHVFAACSIVIEELEESELLASVVSAAQKLCVELHLVAATRSSEELSVIAPTTPQEISESDNQQILPDFVEGQHFVDLVDLLVGRFLSLSQEHVNEQKTGGGAVAATIEKISNALHEFRFLWQNFHAFSLRLAGRLRSDIAAMCESLDDEAQAGDKFRARIVGLCHLVRTILSACCASADEEVKTSAVEIVREMVAIVFGPVFQKVVELVTDTLTASYLFEVSSLLALNAGDDDHTVYGDHVSRILSEITSRIVSTSPGQQVHDQLAKLIGDVIRAHAAALPGAEMRLLIRTVTAQFILQDSAEELCASMFSALAYDPHLAEHTKCVFELALDAIDDSVKSIVVSKTFSPLDHKPVIAVSAIVGLLSAFLGEDSMLDESEADDMSSFVAHNVLGRLVETLYTLPLDALLSDCTFLHAALEGLLKSLQLLRFADLPRRNLSAMETTFDNFTFKFAPLFCGILHDKQEVARHHRGLHSACLQVMTLLLQHSGGANSFDRRCYRSVVEACMSTLDGCRAALLSNTHSVRSHSSVGVIRELTLQCLEVLFRFRRQFLDLQVFWGAIHARLHSMALELYVCRGTHTTSTATRRLLSLLSKFSTAAPSGTTTQHAHSVPVKAEVHTQSHGYMTVLVDFVRGDYPLKVLRDLQSRFLRRVRESQHTAGVSRSRPPTNVETITHWFASTCVLEVISCRFRSFGTAQSTCKRIAATGAALLHEAAAARYSILPAKKAESQLPFTLRAAVFLDFIALLETALTAVCAPDAKFFPPEFSFGSVPSATKAWFKRNRAVFQDWMDGMMRAKLVELAAVAQQLSDVIMHGTILLQRHQAALRTQHDVCARLRASNTTTESDVNARANKVARVVAAVENAIISIVDVALLHNDVPTVKGIRNWFTNLFGVHGILNAISRLLGETRGHIRNSSPQFLKVDDDSGGAQANSQYARQSAASTPQIECRPVFFTSNVLQALCHDVEEHHEAALDTYQSILGNVQFVMSVKSKLGKRPLHLLIDRSLQCLQATRDWRGAIHWLKTVHATRSLLQQSAGGGPAEESDRVLDPTVPVTLLQGLAQFDNGDFEAARRSLSKAGTFTPSDAKVPTLQLWQVHFLLAKAALDTVTATPRRKSPHALIEVANSVAPMALSFFKARGVPQPLRSHGVQLIRSADLLQCFQRQDVPSVPSLLSDEPETDSCQGLAAANSMYAVADALCRRWPSSSDHESGRMRKFRMSKLDSVLRVATRTSNFRLAKRLVDKIKSLCGADNITWRYNTALTQASMKQYESAIEQLRDLSCDLSNSGACPEPASLSKVLRQRAHTIIAAMGARNIFRNQDQSLCTTTDILLHSDMRGIGGELVQSFPLKSVSVSTSVATSMLVEAALCLQNAHTITPDNATLAFEFGSLFYALGLKEDARPHSESRGVAVLKTAVVALFQFLRFSKHDSNYGSRVSCTLRILHLLVQYPTEFAPIFRDLSQSTPATAWTPILPQLCARLRHPNALIADQVYLLLERIARAAPHSLVATVVADETDGEVNDAEDTGAQVEGLLSNFSKLKIELRRKHAHMVSATESLFGAFADIAVLWEDKWHRLLVRLRADFQARFKRFAKERRRVLKPYARKSGHGKMSRGTHIKLPKDVPADVQQLIEQKWLTLMRPLVLSLQKACGETFGERFSALTGHQKQFSLLFYRRVMDLKDYFGLGHHSVDFESVNGSFKLLAQDVKAFSRNSRYISTDQISPALSSFGRDCENAAGSTLPASIFGLSGSNAGLRVTGIGPRCELVKSKTRPKKVELLLNNGTKHVFLLKGHEDLHLDERIMQLLQICNHFFEESSASSTSTSSQAGHSPPLRVMHYAVVPVGMKCGLIQWVNGTAPLYRLYVKYREMQNLIRSGADATSAATHKGDDAGAPPMVDVVKLHPAQLFFHYLKPALQKHGVAGSRRSDAHAVSTLSRRDWPLDVLRTVYNKLSSETPKDVVQNEFRMCSNSAQDFFTRTATYSRSLGVTSMIGYIVGLGDRHLDNILLHGRSGELLHIDYNVCFEKGTKLRVPELVPFRLTQLLRSGLGFMDLRGPFRIACEQSLQMLRDNRETLATLLDAFVYDPLVDWTANKEEDIERADQELSVSMELFASRVDEELARTNADACMANLRAALSSLSQLASFLDFQRARDTCQTKLASHNDACKASRDRLDTARGLLDDARITLKHDIGMLQGCCDRLTTMCRVACGSDAKHLTGSLSVPNTITSADVEARRPIASVCRTILASDRRMPAAAKRKLKDLLRNEGKLISALAEVVGECRTLAQETQDAVNSYIPRLAARCTIVHAVHKYRGTGSLRAEEYVRETLPWQLCSSMQTVLSRHEFSTVEPANIDTLAREQALSLFVECLRDFDQGVLDLKADLTGAAAFDVTVPPSVQVEGNPFVLLGDAHTSQQQVVDSLHQKQFSSLFACLCTTGTFPPPAGCNIDFHSLQREVWQAATQLEHFLLREIYQTRGQHVYLDALLQDVLSDDGLCAEAANGSDVLEALQHGINNSDSSDVAALKVVFDAAEPYFQAADRILTVLADDCTTSTQNFVSAFRNGLLFIAEKRIEIPAVRTLTQWSVDCFDELDSIIVTPFVAVMLPSFRALDSSATDVVSEATAARRVHVLKVIQHLMLNNIDAYHTRLAALNETLTTMFAIDATDATVATAEPGSSLLTKLFQRLGKVGAAASDVEKMLSTIDGSELNVDNLDDNEVELLDDAIATAGAFVKSTLCEVERAVDDSNSSLCAVATSENLRLGGRTSEISGPGPNMHDTQLTWMSPSAFETHFGGHLRSFKQQQQQYDQASDTQQQDVQTTEHLTSELAELNALVQQSKHPTISMQSLRSSILPALDKAVDILSQSRALLESFLKLPVVFLETEAGQQAEHLQKFVHALSLQCANQVASLEKMSNHFSGVANEENVGHLLELKQKLLEIVDRQATVQARLQAVAKQEVRGDWGEDDNEDAAPDLQQDPCPENKNDQTQERNEYAVKVLAQVDQKLRGSIGNAGEAISVEDQVARVIEVATDTTRLCQMYEGWSAWI